jgi:hypothetical protein
VGVGVIKHVGDCVMDACIPPLIAHSQMNNIVQEAKYM